MRKHHELKAWQESMELVKGIYRVTQSFPKEELYGLVSQMRRSAVSVPSNISEGAARGGSREFIQFLMDRQRISERTRNPAADFAGPGLHQGCSRDSQKNRHPVCPNRWLVTKPKSKGEQE